MSSSRPEVRADPLAPIEFVVTCLSALVALLFVVTIPLAVFGSGSIFGLGDSEACAVVDSGVVPFGGGDGPGGFHVDGLRSHASFDPESLRICSTDPSAGVRAAAAIGTASELLLLIGFLVLTWRLIRLVRRTGLFTTTVAARTRTIGWFVLLGSLAAAALELVGNGVVVSSAVANVGWNSNLDYYDMPWALVIVGIGVLTFSRILRQAVELQDDVDATI